MEALLPHYERELSFLRRYSSRFAQRCPKIAGQLLPDDGHGDDPHIAQMIDAIALLNARIGRKLEDDAGQLDEALIDVLYPHYLRPFPACSIAQFTAASTGGDSRHHKLARGTELVSRAIDGVQCRFRTAYDVVLAPLAIREARYSPASAAPVVLPGNAAGVVSITFESTAPDRDLRALDLRSVRIHLNGERSFVAALADGFFLHTLASYVEVDGTRGWQPLRTAPISQAGLDADDALLDYPMLSHPAHRVIFEYFGYQDKFDFVDVDLGAMLGTTGSCRRATLHIVLKEGYGNPHAGRLLASLSSAHFRLFSTPVVNLFRQHGEPVRLTRETVAYPVVADARHASGYDIFSIDDVRLVRQTRALDTVTEFRPFFSLRYGDDRQAGHYWFARRDEAVATKSPGYEAAISVIDVDFDALAAQTDTLSLELTCTNRDLPSRLAVGLDGGDLFLRDPTPGDMRLEIAMLRRPTRPLRFERGDELHLRLASHLGLDYVSIAEMGVEALKTVLVLYDLSRSAASSRQIEGMVAIESRDAFVELPGKPFMTPVQGIEVRLTIDENNFVGTSLAAFVGMIDTFLGNYVHLNNFVQLTVVSKDTGEPILRCKPRSSEHVLA
jgi:type VI secretion system protein ImpG